MEIKDRLKLIIKDKGISQTELSKLLEFSEGGISKYFSGKENPGRKFLTLLQEKLNVSSDWLLTGKGSKYLGTQEKPTLEHPEWVDGLTESEAEKVQQVIKEDKIAMLLFLDTFGGDASSLEAFNNYMKTRYGTKLPVK